MTAPKTTRATGPAVDAEVAEKVMGWRRRPTTNWPMWGFPPGAPLELWHECRMPKFTTDPAADYSVLVKVRETWGPVVRQFFGMSLNKLWNDRMDANIGETNWMRRAQYEPGDYSRAALLALAPKETPDA